MLRDVAAARIKQMLGFRTDQDANIVQAMQEVQETLEKEPELPDFLRKPYSALATVASTRIVNVPADFIREWDGDQMSISNATLDPTNLVKDDLGYLRVRYGNDIATPQRYSLVNRQFYFYPLPDDVYNIDGTYYAEDATLATNIENKWLANVSEVIIGGAGVLLAAGLRDKDALQLFAALQQQGRQKIALLTTANDAAGSKPIMGGED